MAVRTRPGLDRRQVAAAALAVLDRDGIDGLTMRAVGEELGVSAMALYHHIAGKEALLLAVQDASIDEEPMPATSGEGWDADLLALARWMRDRLHAHPGLVAARRHARGWTPAVARVSERWLSIWQVSGLDFGTAATAAAVSAPAVVGYIEQEVTDSVVPRLDHEALADLPNLRAADRRRGQIDADTTFELLVRALITGLMERTGK